MFDDFFHKIEAELGPLNSRWFEELTAKASDNGDKIATVVEGESSAHKVEGIFRAPAKIPVLDSQSMCSTPRIFRRRRPHSPSPGLEDSPDSGTQNLFPVLPGGESSPCLFGFAKDSQQLDKDWGSIKTSACIGLLDTPTGLTGRDTLRTQATSAQRICESLGAQINPDLSWSSSFNTPSALTPTVILSKTEGQSSPVSLLRDKDVIIVRKLFPSLSKGTESTSASTSSVQHNDALSNRNAQAEKSDSSSDNVEGVWRQTVPDAIKDGDVRNTVESVLNDAEDVLSFFFTNSGSALRRVKTKDRKKRQNAVSKEVNSNPGTVDHTADCASASKTAECLKSPLFSSQHNNKDFTQWTPLSLSDVQDSKTNQSGVSDTAIKLASPHVDSLDRKNVTQSSSRAKQQRTSPDPSYGQSTLLEASPALTFSRKPRKFVYQVQNPESKIIHSDTDSVVGKHFQEPYPCHKENAHTGDTKEDNDNAGCLNVDHDLNMTQLCKAFAEDFTQETKSFKSPHKSAHSGLDQQPACMTIEISKVQDTKEPVMPRGGDFDHQAAETTNPTHIQSLENTVCDSGCNTVCSGFSLEAGACSGNERLHPGFKTANNTIIVVPPEALKKAKASLDKSLERTTCKDASSETDPANGGTQRYNSYKHALANTAGEKRLLASYHPGHEAGRERETDESVLISEAAAESIPSTFLCQTNESGFKTASNKSITVSSANLEKAKDIFTELEEETFDPHTSNNELQVRDVKDAKSGLKNTRKPSSGNDDGDSSLTASQRADVTELCSMLEEAGSQYEFTQFKGAKIGSKCPDGMHSEREWDPDILSDIDFDDSFNSDLTDKQVSKKHHSKVDVHASVLNSVTNGDVGFHKESELMTNMADDNVQEKSFCPGFKTAKGNAMKISEKCLSKARSLFADIEDTDGNFFLHNDVKADHIKQKEEQSGDHQDNSCKNSLESERKLNPGLNACNGNAGSITKVAATCKLMRSNANMVNLGFSTAGGKEVKISEKALHNAKKLLNEAANDQESSSLTSGHNSFNVLADVLQDSKMYDGSVPEGTDFEHHFENGPDIKHARYESVVSNGFKMTSGKGVSVSTSATRQSKTIFGDLNDRLKSSDEMKSTGENGKLDLVGDTGEHAFVNGLEMASGKGASFSELLFKNCAEVLKGDDASAMDDRGFEAVAGNMVQSPGTDGLNKETLKNDSVDLNRHVQRKFTKTSSEIVQPPSGCGFTTASGAAVSVSAEALHRAKAMLDDSNAAPPEERGLKLSEEKLASKNDFCGFSTASGKKVAVCDKALQKAKSLFTDCNVDVLGPDACQLPSAKTTATSPGHIRLPLNAASHKNIAASQKETNDCLEAFATCDSVSVDTHKTEIPFTSQNGTYISKELSTKNGSLSYNSGKSKQTYENTSNGGPKFDPLGNVGFSTASGKGVRVSKSALEVAFEMFKGCDGQEVTDRQIKISNDAPDTNMNKTPVVPKPKSDNPCLPPQTTLDNPSHSLTFDGCTVTQQRYFEQEAMACTKALLEDDLNENGSLSNLDNEIQQSPTLVSEKLSEVKTGIGKRPSDDKSLTGQPPLKRRLVSEFDQISEAREVCTAVKCSPNGTLNDRRVFKYHLKPNITYPSRDVVDQTSANPDHQQKRQSDPKAPVFIPPFRKKAETPTHSVPPAAAQVPSAFVPPIKKQDVSGSVYVKGSTQHTGDTPAITSSNSENSRNHSDEEQNAVTGTKRVENLENRTSVPCETKVVWQQSLELAQDMQNMRIRKKKRQRVRPLPGTFYLTKTSGVKRISLKEAVGDKCLGLHTEEQLYQHGVSFKASQISSENSESFQFSCDEFFKREVLRESGGIQLADGGWLIPDKRGMLGKDEFYRALCDTPGVDPKLISEAWVYNHYRWVVWKRASMERAFPEIMGGRCLTPEQVLLQLKLRYDVEVDHSRRSALKKIMERDDTPAKTIVLCMCSTAKCDPSPVRTEETTDTADAKPVSPAAVIWLTDGWYSIKALLDVPLSTMLQKGCLKEGVKLLIHGAELIGSQDACPPLEAPESLMLKISANSTRRARWDTKLGFYKDPRPFPLVLSSLYTNGGVVSCVDVIVLRSYPIQWMEKKAGSVFVFRNERAEGREAARYNSTKEKTMELLFSKIQAQVEKEEEEKKKTKKSRTLNLHEIKNLQEGEELHEALEIDPALVEAHLTTQQVKAVSSYRRALTEKKRAKLQDRVHKAVQEAEGGCANRDVTPVWKLSIADSNDLHSSRVYTLNIWRPSTDLRCLLREGCRYKAYHLATSETKKRSGTSNIQFTATKKTQFQDIEVCPEWLNLHFPVRQSAQFRDLQSPGFSCPCGEVDVVGYVISILDRQGTSPVLYIVDERFDFVSVRICSSLALLALEDLVKPLALLAVSNLQLRQQSGPVPSLYAGEQALFSTNPKEAHLQDNISRLKTFVEDYEHFFIVAEEKLSNLIPTGLLNSCESPRTPGLSSAPKTNVRNSVTPHQTSRVFSPFTPVTKRTPVPSGDSDIKDPRSVKRKRGLEYLSRIQNPAPLLPLGMVRSPKVSKTFNPPRRCEAARNPQTVPNPPPENK